MTFNVIEHRNTCEASNNAYNEYGNGTPPNENGKTHCPMCHKFVKLKRDHRGMLTIIPTHKRAR